MKGRDGTYSVPTCGHPDRRVASYGRCKSCAVIAYRQANPERRKAWTRKAKTGWSAEAYEQAKLDQLSKCAICGNEEELVADHDHVQKRPRALLCRTCNLGLGYFKDNPKLMEEAANYIRQHS